MFNGEHGEDFTEILVKVVCEICQHNGLVQIVDTNYIRVSCPLEFRRHHASPARQANVLNVVRSCFSATVPPRVMVVCRYFKVPELVYVDMKGR